MEEVLIPANEKGKQNDIESSRDLSTSGEARKVFVRAYKRLLHPNVWGELGGNEKAAFQLVDASGKMLRRQLKEKDFIQIDVPGPATKAGAGFDWVQVDLVEDWRNHSTRSESFSVRLITCANPTNANLQTAHFFEKGASSTFEIVRNDNSVSVRYHGRNEKVNNHTGNIADNIRNSIVGTGALLGLSELQWKAMVEGFLKEETRG